VSGHVGGILRYQERHDARDLLDSAEAPDRNVTGALLQFARIPAREEALGGDRPGADGVDQNAVRGELERHRARELDQARLSKVVDCAVA